MRFEVESDADEKPKINTKRDGIGNIALDKSRWIETRPSNRGPGYFTNCWWCFVFFIVPPIAPPRKFTVITKRTRRMFLCFRGKTGLWFFLVPSHEPGVVLQWFPSLALEKKNCYSARTVWNCVEAGFEQKRRSSCPEVSCLCPRQTFFCIVHERHFTNKINTALETISFRNFVDYFQHDVVLNLNLTHRWASTEISLFFLRRSI